MTKTTRHATRPRRIAKRRETFRSQRLGRVTIPSSACHACGGYGNHHGPWLPCRECGGTGENVAPSGRRSPAPKGGAR